VKLGKLAYSDALHADNIAHFAWRYIRAMQSKMQSKTKPFQTVLV